MEKKEIEKSNKSAEDIKDLPEKNIKLQETKEEDKKDTDGNKESLKIGLEGKEQKEEKDSKEEKKKKKKKKKNKNKNKDAKMEEKFEIKKEIKVEFEEDKKVMAQGSRKQDNSILRLIKNWEDIPYLQTNPPSIPLTKQFPSGGLPIGKIFEYVGK